MKKYKKVIVVEAQQITDDDFGRGHPNPRHIKGVIYSPTNKTAWVGTNHGPEAAAIGDWIIRKDGELSVCPRHEFEDEFEAI